MRKKPIFFAKASEVTIQGDMMIQLPSSFKYVYLSWRNKGLYIHLDQGASVKLALHNNVEVISESKLIPWPKAGEDQAFSILSNIESDDQSRNIALVLVTWTDVPHAWSSFKDKIKDYKSEVFLTEIEDVYEEVMRLSSGDLCQESFDTLKSILAELDSNYAAAIIPKETYEKVSSDWRAEIYLYCTRLLSDDLQSNDLCAKCSDFVLSYLKRQ